MAAKDEKNAHHIDPGLLPPSPAEVEKLKAERLEAIARDAERARAFLTAVRGVAAPAESAGD